MSVDLNFWRYKEEVAHDNGKVYESACCDGKIMDELENLPINEILEKIASTFSDWAVNGQHEYEKEGHGSFVIFSTSQVVRFDCYGMKERDMNLLMDMLIDFGCPLYDPAISTRFDSWTDR